MKTKIMTLLLAGILGISLAACGDGGAASVLEASSEAQTLSEEVSEEENESKEVPKAVQNLSEEKNALLNGNLKDGVYTNEFFGYKVTAPDGATFVRYNDEAAETKEPLSISEGYAEGWGGIYYSCSIDELYTCFSVVVGSVKDDETGLNEKELVERKMENLRETYQLLGDDKEEMICDTVALGGEEHPAIMHSSETEKGEQECIEFYILKDDFVLNITIYATGGKMEDLLKCFEKL